MKKPVECLSQVQLYDLVTATRKVAELHPEAVRGGEQSCMYFDTEGLPCCLLGHAMAQLGVHEGTKVTPDETIGQEYNTKRISAVLVTMAASEGHFLDPSPEGQWLGQVQEAQDAGMTWQQAVFCADLSTEDVEAVQ